MQPDIACTTQDFTKMQDADSLSTSWKKDSAIGRMLHT